MKIVFFDGYCSLCNTMVEWLIRIDKKDKLKFASLQGETAKKLLGVSKHTIDIDTLVYLRDKERFEQSTAVLHILIDIGGAWSLVKVFFIFPKFFRDFFYRVIAKNRYRFIKKLKTCRVPNTNKKEKLLP